MYKAVSELTAYHLMALIGAIEGWVSTQAVEAQEILEAYEVDLSDPVRDLLESADAIIVRGKLGEVVVVMGDIRITTKGNHYIIVDDGENAFSVKASMVAPHWWYYAQILGGKG